MLTVVAMSPLLWAAGGLLLMLLIAALIGFAAGNKPRDILVMLAVFAALWIIGGLIAAGAGSAGGHEPDCANAANC